MIENHVPIPITDFNGLWDRGPDEAIPLDHFSMAQNLKFKPSAFYTREGSILDVVCGAVLRFHVYKITGQASRLLILLNNNSIYDSVNMAAPILTIPGMIDFSMETFFDRAYITPHNGTTGLPGQFVHYYTGSGIAKIAGGGGPPSGQIIGVEGGPGNFDAGVHAWAVSFETASGFITQFGAFGATGSATGGKVFNLSNIPIGPAGTIARVLMGTKNVQEGWNNDYANQEWFIIPNGRIADNVTTIKTVSYFDADLTDQADYILEQLSAIPAGVGITSYQGSMVVWGEDANQSTVRVSRAGQPESFNSVEGFLQVEPTNGGGVRNCVEFRSSLYILKSQRCYATQATDQEAAFWICPLLDGSIGTECHGIGKIFERNSNTVDKYLVSSRRGILLFTGNFSEELTWKVKDIWNRITKTHFHRIQVAIDSDAQFVYISLPLDGSLVTNAILFGDYTQGLDSAKIKWSLWAFPNNPVSIALDVDDVSKAVIFRYAREGQNIYRLDANAKNDYDAVIISAFETSQLPTDSKGEVFHHGGVRFRVYGEGNLDLTVTCLDSAQVYNLSAIALQPGPGVYHLRTYNAQSEKITIRGALNNINQYMTVTKLWVFVRQLWLTRPS